MKAASRNPDRIVATDPLGEVKRATVAIGKIAEGEPLADARSYYDGTDLAFEVDATGFIYVHTPLEFAEGKSEPDPKTGTVYYWARMWFVTCKHCIPESGVVAVRLNTRTGGTRVYLFGSEQWTLHPSEDVAVCPLGLGREGRGNEEVAADIENLEFQSISDKLTAGKAQILKTGFYESTPVSMIGFPIGMIEGGRKNYPVVRSGTIAQIQGHLDGDPEHTGFLIDGSVFGGNSGGPVVVRKGTLNADSRALSASVLIGMVSGSSYTNAKYEDESSSEVMENAGLVHAITVDAINATIRLFFVKEGGKPQVRA